MEESYEENLHQDDSTISASERKRTFSELEQEPTEPAEKVPRVANSSENDELECVICKEVITTQVVGQPENCQHKFCLSCLIEWSKRENICPLDRQKFNKILLPNAGKPNVEDFVNISVVVVEDDNENMVEENVEAEDEAHGNAEEVNETHGNAEEANETHGYDELASGCELCLQDGRFEMVYDCFNCSEGFHLSCLTPPLSEVPILEGKSCCPKCFQRVCYVCGGRPSLGAYVEDCLRCEMGFHPNCHASSATDEYGKLALCPACYLGPEASNQ